MTQPLSAQTMSRLRTAAALLGVVFAIAIAAFVVFLPSGERGALPPAIVSVSPADQSTVSGATPVSIVLVEGVTADVFLDGTLLDVGGTSGALTWSPGPDQRFEVWPAGSHTVEVRFQSGSAGVYRFSFVVP